MAEGDLELVRDAVEAFNAGGMEASLRYFDPRIEWKIEVPWLEAQVFRGYDGLAQINRIWTENFDRYRWEDVRLFDSGEGVVVLVKHRGVAKQGGMDIDQPLGMIFEVVDGRARRVRGWIEWEDALRAAGLDPAAAAAG